MEKKQMLAVVEEKIYEACPELKELKFGCEVMCEHRASNSFFSDTICSHYRVSRQMMKQDCLPKDSVLCWKVTRGYAQPEIQRIAGKVINEPVFRILNVIGHPITLESVLKALGKLNEEPEFDNDINFVQHSTSLCIYNQDIDDSCNWEFGKPLSEQNPEVWEFLYKLFNQK